ncbi:rhomboid family intramembrane serine protease [Rhodovibrio sodomensis]|uniref:rhomboid family intramembrane serine protease n=1 Tax=Rhodovibrio sodomensis TaxID=1088 RepID=UPI001908B915|nr:rhomboid family intramembrane serine protease [Rhodovibrio sodomensis]
MSIRPNDRKPPPPPPRRPGKPAVNLPPAVGWLIGINVAVYLVTAVIPVDWTNALFFNLGFVPARWTVLDQPGWQGLISPFTHQFLHAGPVHLIVNMVMLAAFGAGVAKLLGGRRLVAIYLVSGLAGAGLHYAFYPATTIPVVGASGAISGLFGAVLRLMAKQAQVIGRRTRILPIALIWVGIAAITGFTGVPGASGGAQVAWAAHVGGFLAGLLTFDLFTIGLRPRRPPHLRDVDDDDVRG